MANESINLNLIPTGEMPVIHVSQFDNGRQFNINLLKGSDEYTLPAGYTAALNCRKADRNIVTLAATTASSNTLTFTTTTQLCACAGNNLCEVVIKDAEDYQVGTLNFILAVEKDPLQGGIDSTSEIHDLTDQIEDITTEIVGENYYNKTETDTLLDAKANAADVYTKTQVDTALSAKANTADLATVATTGSYTDLTNTPDIPAAQVQSDYAQSDNTKVDYIKNKPDINGMIAAAIYDIMPESTVTGSVASFNADIEKPLSDLTVGSSATKLYQTSGDASNAPYFRGTILGTFGFIDLSTLEWGYSNSEQLFWALIPNTKTTYSYSAIIDNYNYINNFSGDNGWNNSSYFGGDINLIIKDSNYSDTEAFKASLSDHYMIFEVNTAVSPATDLQFETVCTAFDIEDDIYILPVTTNPTAYNGDNNFFTDNGDITVSYKESIQHYIDRKVGT